MTRIDVDRRISGVTIIALIGEHETYSTPDVDREIASAFAEGSAVIVDLSETEFLDSSIVTALLRARDEAAALGVRFALVVDDSTGWSVRQLLEITGLAGVFPIAETRDDAIAGAA